MKIKIEFNFLNKSSEEILEYFTNLVKQYCLEAEWKQLESVFVEFYALYKLGENNYNLEKCINSRSDECDFVIKLLNNLYINSAGRVEIGSEIIARTLTYKIADRCSCYNHLTF